jgi:ubiquinone/menaquinone biosynthesis C-methylase UbiE
MHKITRAGTRPEPAGLVIHGAAQYDFFVWLFTLGGERRMRARMLSLAQLGPGEQVLDMGCGTGTLAILAKRQVGPSGGVTGVDASPEMIGRAKEKARRAGVDVSFIEGTVQALPIPDASVDVVVCTLMLHHVPKTPRAEVAREIKRVLKPDGRFLAVDFMKPLARDQSVWSRFHRHGAIDLAAFAAELEKAGLHLARSGELGEKNMHYALATAGLPTAAQGGDAAQHRQAHGRPSAHGLVALLLAALAVSAIGLHIGAAASLSNLASRLGAGLFWYALAAAVVLIVMVKGGLVGLAHRLSGDFLTRWLDAREEKRE